MGGSALVPLELYSDQLSFDEWWPFLNHVYLLRTGWAAFEARAGAAFASSAVSSSPKEPAGDGDDGGEQKKPDTPTSMDFLDLMKETWESASIVPDGIDTTPFQPSQPQPQSPQQQQATEKEVASAEMGDAREQEPKRFVWRSNQTTT